MPLILDVDAHFEPGPEWLEPFPELAKRLPPLDPALLAVDAIVGDLLHYVPENERPPMAELVPPGMAYGQRAIGDDIPANAALVFHIELVRLEDAAD